jgi:hypothetical protein
LQRFSMCLLLPSPFFALLGTDLIIDTISSFHFTVVCILLWRLWCYCHLMQF